MSTQDDNYFAFLAQHVITPFYLKRLAALENLRLDDVLKRKNPYLFKAKNIELAGDLAKGIVDAFLSSQEETLFGNLLEGFAVYVAHTLYDGKKSARKSIDLEFWRDEIYYIVGIKSGTSWGNSDQIAAMKNNFKAARKALRAEGIAEKVVAVNGCMYGRDANPKKLDADKDKIYFRYAGQDFWNFLSGDDDLYRRLIAPIDKEAKQKDTAFRAAYNKKVHELTLDFSLNFLRDGQIDWEKLIDYVSARERISLQIAEREHAATEQKIEEAKSEIAEEK